MQHNDVFTNEISEPLRNEVDRWADHHRSVAAGSPELARAHAELAAVPARKGVLDRKTRELIALAVNASTTQLFTPGIREHARNALDAGATREELTEVLELCSVLGIHSATTGMPILLEELRRAGIDVGAELSESQRRVKEEFIAARGGWTDFLEAMLILTPELVEGYIHLSSVPWRKGILPPRVKELIYIAIDSQVSHIYELGMRLHIGNALRAGVTADEIVAVFEVISTLGIHSATTGIPIVFEEAQALEARREIKADKPN